MNAPLYRLEVRSTSSSSAWRESFGTWGGPGVSWASVTCMFRYAAFTTAQREYDDMIYRVVQA